jgi:hypothetical protein
LNSLFEIQLLPGISRINAKGIPEMLVSRSSRPGISPVFQVVGDGGMRPEDFLSIEPADLFK